MKFLAYFFITLIQFLPFYVFAQYEEGTLRPPVETYVSNPDYIITSNKASEISRKLLDFESKTSMEIVVVALASVGNEVPKEFGLKLFNEWGIGKKEKNNGLMILLVKDQRRIEFIPGTGLKEVITQAKSIEIQQMYMLSYFRADDYGGGINAGIDELISFLGYYNSMGAAGVFYSNLHPALKIYFIIGTVVILVFLLFIIFSLIIAFGKKDPFAAHKTLHPLTHIAFVVLFPIHLILPLCIIYFLKYHYRNITRNGPVSGKKMRKLSEEEEDEYLSKIQIKEESLSSIQYDVWVSVEGDEVLILDYPQFSKYKKCSSCKAKSFSFDKKSVISSPSYSNSGRGEKVWSCKNCSKKRRVTFTIPRLVESTSSYSGSSSSSSSYSSSSYSSSSSSFGGGSSSGGGGGSSW
jgi:uncharacterized protein